MLRTCIAHWMAPGYVLTSILKRVDVAVYETIKTGAEPAAAAGVAGLRKALRDGLIDGQGSVLLPITGATTSMTVVE